MNTMAEAALSSSSSSSRLLGMAVSTTKCIGVREQPYPFLLELVYDYLIEYALSDDNNTRFAGDEPDLIGIENAVAFGVAGTLDACDEEDDSPLYAVELASRHDLLQNAFCAPVNVSNVCKVIRGYTVIRLHDSVPDVEMAAYDAIKSVLEEPLFLDQFVTTNYDRVHFLRVVDHSLTEHEPDGGPFSISKVVLIVASVVSCALVSIFLIGYMRKNASRTRSRLRKKMLAQTQSYHQKRLLLGSAPRMYYELDEEQGSSGSGFKLVQIMEQLENPSVTWSISDITSESGSILSNLSRNSLKLERIEEADDESQTDEEWDGASTGKEDHNHGCPSDSIYLDRLGDLPPSSLRHHVYQWDVDTMDESTDPEGCQYLDDSYEEIAEDDGLERAEQGVAVGIDADGPANKAENAPSDNKTASALSSVLDTSDATIDSSKESSVVSDVNISGDIDADQDDEKVQKWLTELIEELRKAQARKMLTYPEA